MGRLTTHVLDTAHGRPGGGIAVTVYRLGASDARLEVARAVTNADGRTDRPVLEGADFIPGVYEIVFAAGDYFARTGAKLPHPPFVGDVVLRFGVANPAEHYHVPLLVSPWSYQTYRGS
ncbi:MAG: hydroxyisourate hydrolase [Burkholderiales bacterium]